MVEPSCRCVQVVGADRTDGEGRQYGEQNLDAPPRPSMLIETQEDWPRIIRKAWQSSPAMAVHMGERFKHAPVQTEITKLVRSEPKRVIHVAEALHFLLGDRIEPASRSALKVSLPSATGLLGRSD